MTYEPTFDFETYSEAGFVWEPPSDKKPLGRWTCLPNAPQGKKGLPIVGASVYSEHPTADVLCLRYDIHGDHAPKLWRPGMPLPYDLFDYLARGGIIEAHNAMFERLIWENVCVPKYGFPPLNPYNLRCSMATARVNNLPGKLENLGDVLQVVTKKDADGKRLLAKFSVPRNPTKGDERTRITPDDDPADAERLYDYCADDVRSEQECAALMEPMSPAELLFWQIDQEINHRGLGVDRKGVRDCIAVLQQAIDQYGAECVAITNGLEAGQLAEIRGWLAAQGVALPDMQAETVEMKLADPTLPPHARRVLEIRSLIGSASVKKLFAMEYQANRNDRLQNLIVHHGARTGRPTGEGPQPLNLPKAGPKLVTCGACQRPHRHDANACPWCNVPCPPIERKRAWKPDMVPHVLEIMGSRVLGLVEFFFGDALLAIMGCVRGLFQAADGYDLIASDYSAIEAVVLAMLAGEQWRIDAFVNDEPIYLVGASKITGKPLAEYLAYYDQHGDHHPDRQNIGKVSELACGFGGWIGSYKAFGSTEPDDVIKAQIVAWRAASPAIVEFWGGQWRGPPWRREHRELFGMEGAFISAVHRRGEEIRPACCPTVAFTYAVDRDVLHITLPSGRRLAYHSPRLATSRRNADELEISYMTWNSNPKYGPMGWVRMDTYGGRLTENVVQAVAHDILRHAIINLRAAGYPTVLHVYDEIVAEIPCGTGSVEQFEAIMATLPPWCAGWPVRASGGWRGKRYRKG
jgi:DNA polymerase